MKKELFALLAILLLIIGSIGNVRHLIKTTNDISNHIYYSGLYCSLDDYTAANTEMNKALDIWESEENYTHVFIRHSEIDTISDVLYDTLSAINNREKYDAEFLLQKLQHHLDTLVKMERISIGSIF